jgi:hypothetical protein
MKKVFIGCGVVVLLGLIAIGYLAYRIAPDIQRLNKEWQAAIAVLESLDERFPFDPKAQTELDVARFDQMLDVRLGLGEYLKGLEQQVEELEQAEAEDRGPGFVGTIKEVIGQLSPVLTQFATRLEAASMSWQEFAWHTRVLWGALARIDAGLGNPELDALRGEYKKFDAHYEAVRREQGELPPLKDLLADLPPEALVAAEQVLVRDVGRVHRALVLTEVDHLYMQPIEGLEQIEKGKLPALSPSEPAGAGPR